MARAVAVGEVPAGFADAGYYTRGFLFHALGSENSRKILRSHYEQQMNDSKISTNDRLVRAGMLLHYVVDLHVHPNDPIGGHAPTHEPDYTINHPDSYQAAVADAYGTLRKLYVTAHPDAVLALGKRESAFSIDYTNPHGTDSFAKKVVDAIIAAYPPTRFHQNAKIRAAYEVDVPRITVQAKANLREAFQDSFKKLGEESIAIPEFRIIKFEPTTTGELRFERTGTNAIKGAVVDPVASVRSKSNDDLNVVRHELGEFDQQFVTLVKKANRATEPDMGVIGLSKVVELARDGTVKITKSAEQRLAGSEGVGGVKLDVLASFLSTLDIPVARAGHRMRSVTDPVLVSLKNVLSRVDAAGGKWPTDEQLLSLGGLTRIYGCLFDAARSDIVLIGTTEHGVPPIGLENLVVAIRDVTMKCQTPAVSLDPDPNNTLTVGPQYSRVLGIGADTAFAKVSAGRRLRDETHHARRGRHFRHSRL